MRSHGGNPPSVDELYGLEPVIELDDGEAFGGDAAGVQPRTVQCPYCGEPFGTTVDVSGGSTSYIEDCQVCCQPIEFVIEVAEDGKLESLRVSRGD